MPLLLVFAFGGWPLAAYIRSRIHKGRRVSMAIHAAVVALFLSSFIGIPLIDLCLMWQRTEPVTLRTHVVFLLNLVWHAD